MSQRSQFEARMPLLVNPRVLSRAHIPSKLPHREPQLSTLQSLFRDAAEGQPVFKVVQLVGPKGTGKTTSAHLLQRHLNSRNPSVAHVYLNLRALNDPSPWVVYAQLVARAGGRPSRSLSAGELFEKFVELLGREKGRAYVLTVDEAEQLTGYRSLHGGRIVYNLTRLPEFGVENVSGVLFISREEGWAQYLAPEEQSSLGAIVVKYPSYTRGQLFDILAYRASEAFTPEAVPESVVEYLAEVVEALFDSDVRKALDILLLSGQIAETEGAEKLSIEHVNRAVEQSLRERYLFSQSVDQLGTAERVVLLAVLLAAREAGQSFVTQRDIQRYVAFVCESYKLRQPTAREQEEALQRLSDEGFIQFRGPLRVYVTTLLPPSARENFSSVVERLLPARVR